MPEVTFQFPDGSERSIDASPGTTIMTIASEAGIPGIIAECGGGAMCATCHVYVDEAWLDRLPLPDDGELEMLDCTTAERLPTSRLSCQVKLTNDLSGLRVRVPDRQR